ncbi:MAG: LLM class flavin-dependent oxidoreductase [Microthrixaceae bacterium]|nr:LLM class flavin-dependent oxidoreductase [Microthrixaceae bacterium]
MFLMRFDLRSPGADASQRAARYRTAIEMSAWAEERGCVSVVLSEHHSSEDGYLASPLTLAASIAAVTRNVRIVVAATLLPLHDPVRLAEEIIALDHISEGRVLVVLGLGYRPEEYELAGLDYRRRARLADERLAELLDVLDTAGDTSAWPRVTPAPFSPPRRRLAWGGRSIAAARRAGRFGIGFFAQTDGAGLAEAYEQAATEAGHTPGLCLLPPPEMPLIVFVNDDLDEGWNDVGEAMALDARGYYEWSSVAGTAERTASFSKASDVESLRAANGAHRVVSATQAKQLVAEYFVLGLHPLCGGLDPQLAWEYLRRAADAVGPPRFG